MAIIAKNIIIIGEEPEIIKPESVEKPRKKLISQVKKIEEEQQLSKVAKSDYVKNMMTLEIDINN